MNAALRHLEQFAAKPLCFSCKPTKRPGTGAASEAGYPSARTRVLNHVSHKLNSPLTAAGERLLRKHAGQFVDQFLPIYRAHNGFSLYKDEQSDAIGFEMLPVQRWAETNAEFKAWVASMPTEQDPAQLRDGLAFGSIPESPDGFVMALKGKYAGKIFLFRHDDTYMPPFANNFGALIHRVTEKPVELLTKVFGGYYQCAHNGRRIWVPDRVVEAATDAPKVRTRRLR